MSSSCCPPLIQGVPKDTALAVTSLRVMGRAGAGTFVPTAIIERLRL